MLVGGWGLVIRSGFALSEGADADGAVGVEAEDFEEGENDRRSSRDDRAADDGHLALVNVATPDGEAAVDDARNAEDEAEHHDYGEAVADAGLEVGGTEGCGLCEAGRVLRARTAAATRSDGSRERIFGWMCLMIFIRVVLFFMFLAQRLHSLHHTRTLPEVKKSLACVAHILKKDSC